MRLISPKPALRDKPPTDVLEWNNFQSWESVIWELISDVVNDDVKKHFLAAPPECIACDDLSWLNDRIYSVSRESVDIKSILTQRILRWYKVMRTFHGTRTNNISSYYKYGLRPLVPAETQQKVRDIFLSGRFPNLTEGMLVSAIEDVETVCRKNLIFFDANESNHVWQYGHYLIYGSEYLYCLATRLSGDERNAKILRSIGRPTLFQCDVPLENLTNSQVQNYAGLALEAIFCVLLNGNDFDPLGDSGATISINIQLPPEAIVGHYHPERIYDPYRRIWHLEQST